MSYPPFRGNAWAAYKASKLDGKKQNIGALMMDTAAVLSLGGSSSDTNHIFFELLHYGHRHRVYNVSKALGERLAATKFELSLECMHVPEVTFEICFEDGLKVPDTDIQMPSCLIQFGINDEAQTILEELNRQCGALQQKMLNDMARRLKRRTPIVKNLGVYVKDQFSCTYGDPYNPDPLTPIICTCNLRIGEDDGKTADEIIDNMPLLKGSKTIVPLDDRDLHVQRHVLRAVIGTLLYMNTKDPDIQSYKFKDRPALGSFPPTAFLVGGKMERMPPGYHLRDAHFRTLRHERFKRDDEGKIKVIWINMTEIGVGRPPALSAKRDEADLK